MRNRLTAQILLRLRLFVALLISGASVRVVQADVRSPVRGPGETSERRRRRQHVRSIHTKRLHHRWRRRGHLGHDRSIPFRLSADQRRRGHRCASRLRPGADPWSKAGVMIRSSLERRRRSRVRARIGAKRRRLSMARAVERRQQQPVRRHGDRTQVGSTDRAGTRVTAYTSADGATWKSIGSAPIAIGTSVVRRPRRDQS